MIKFVDEAVIRVEAGKGGAGALSFRREKFIPRGGPDGGDGGDGGSVYLLADPHVNTLAEFRYQRLHRAQNGESGMGKLCTGKSGADLVIPVPLGTAVYDADTEEFIGELLESQQRLCVAKGGFHGLGNTRYKSSTNRSPRQTTPGFLGEQRNLKLELSLLADIGLCGLPNAGKSTLIRAVSNATPKVADYPFTTLHPHLGVVRVGEYQSFVMADIPGLVAGASEGLGLGAHFLRHLTRTRLLLHVMDIASGDEVALLTAFQTITLELQRFHPDLANKERWLVFNKIDLLSAQEVEQRCQALLHAINWQGPVFQISAISRQGTEMLCYRLMERLASL